MPDFLRKPIYSSSLKCPTSSNSSTSYVSPYSSSSSWSSRKYFANDNKSFVPTVSSILDRTVNHDNKNHHHQVYPSSPPLPMTTGAILADDDNTKSVNQSSTQNNIVTMSRNINLSADGHQHLVEDNILPVT